MSQINPDIRYARRDEIVAAPVENELVMMSIERDAYFGLDELGSRVWTLLESPASIGEICDQLMAEYEVDASECRTVVAGLLEELATHELVRRVEE